MPITGTEAALAASLKSAIEAKLTAATGQPLSEPTWLQAFCEAVAETIIPHFVNNVQVEPGQVVPATGILDSVPLPCTGASATSTPTTIT